MKDRAAFVVTYLGIPWPSWFDAYLISCSRNSQFRWLFFTDQETPAWHPNNVFFINLSLEAFVKKANNSYDFPVSLDPSFLYKLCDFKIGYGLIFEEWLNCYEYWGHCDIDIVWGDIGKYVEEMMGHYDIITTRREHFAGHCTLYRMDPKLNREHINISGLSRILSDTKRMYSVSERIAQKHFATSSEWRIFASDLEAGFLDGLIDDWPADIEYEWTNGKLLDNNGTERLYVHFRERKKSMRCEQFKKPFSVNRFRIGSSLISTLPSAFVDNQIRRSYS